MHNFATYSRDEQKPSRIICSSGQQMKTLQSSSCVCNPSQVLLSAELLFYELKTKHTDVERRKPNCEGNNGNIQILMSDHSVLCALNMKTKMC